MTYYTEQAANTYLDDEQLIRYTRLFKEQDLDGGGNFGGYEVVKEEDGTYTGIFTHDDCICESNPFGLVEIMIGGLFSADETWERIEEMLENGWCG